MKSSVQLLDSISVAWCVPTPQAPLLSSKTLTPLEYHGANLKIKVEMELREEKLYQEFSFLFEEQKALFKNWLKQWDHHFLNEQSLFSHFSDLNSFVILNELALNFIKKGLSSAFRGIQFKILWNEQFFMTYDFTKSEITSSQGIKIQCVHRHRREDFDEKQNEDLYGPCSRLHGHEYEVHTHLHYPLDGRLKDENLNVCQRHWLNEEIYTPYQGQYLNEKIGNTSGEIILRAFYKKLFDSQSVYFTKSDPFSLSLRETKKNKFYLNSVVEF